MANSLSLIIGANGYLGQYLALGFRGRDCILHSRSSPSIILRRVGLPFIREDLVSGNRSLRQSSPSTVYILARPPNQKVDEYSRFERNLLSLVDAWLDRSCVKRIVFAST